VIPRAGGEARALTDGKHAISDFAWSPDGKRLACLGPEPKSDEDEKKEKNKDDEHVVDKVERHARLWLADARERRTELAGDGALASSRASRGCRRAIASWRLPRINRPSSGRPIASC
jgi:dipeptidyl aminopeptidase/acylaminoacyl peptidase